MEWTNWIGKRVFVKLKTGASYSGKIIDVDDSEKILVWFTMRDKFGDMVTFVHSEILKIKEEENEKSRSPSY